MFSRKLVNVIAQTENSSIATVYIAEFPNGKQVEFVESVQPPKPISEKWVLIVSTLFGCPVGCMMCDAGGGYKGKLNADQILEQIHYVVNKRFADGFVPSKQFKIQFARMGEPALNAAVNDVLQRLPRELNAPGLIPSISTIAPANSTAFFERLLEIKSELYSNGRFQMQFSLHSSDPRTRDRIVPIKKWSFEQIAEYGTRFYSKGDRKITLNFALAKGSPLDPEVLLRYFDPEHFLIKLTPVNPTYTALQNGLETYFTGNSTEDDPIIMALQDHGYDVILSIGELEENKIGSNCGQFILKHKAENDTPTVDAYSYRILDNAV